MTNKQLRTILSFLAFLTGGLGVIFIGYGSFDNNKKGQSGKIAGTQEVRLVQNAPLNLEKTSINNFDNGSEWGRGIDSTKSLNLKTPYFSLSENGDFIVGKLDKNLKFVKLFELDDEPEIIQIYTDSDIAYLVKNKFIQSQVLVLESENTVDSLILPVEGDIISMFYDSAQSVFYFSARSEAGELVIYSLLNNLQIIELERTSIPGIFTKIIGLKNDSLYLKSGSQCYKFNMYSRETSKKKCISVYKDLGEDIVVHEEGTVFLESLERKILLSDDSKFEYDDFQQYKGKIYFIQYLSDVIEDKSIGSIDFESGQYDEVKSTLPKVYLAESFIAYDKYFITNGSEIYFTDLESDSVAPNSYPESYPVDALPAGWKKLELVNSTSQITLLNSRVPELTDE